MFADEIRRQAEAAPRAALPAIASAMWRAFAEGHVTEAEAEALSALIEARQAPAPRRVENAGGSHAGRANLCDAHVLTAPDLGASNPENPGLPPDRQRSPRTGIGSRPRTDASMERRRRWAASGRLPPAIAARFSLAEHAVLACVAAETARRGDCRLAIEHMAAVVGVSRSTVRNAIREARKLGLLAVEERRVAGRRSGTNIVRIVSPEWTAWLRLTRKGDPLSKSGSSARLAPQRGGVKSLTTTPTQIFKPGKTGTARPPRGRVAAIGRAS